MGASETVLAGRARSVGQVARTVRVPVRPVPGGPGRVEVSWRQVTKSGPAGVRGVGTVGGARVSAARPVAVRPAAARPAAGRPVVVGRPVRVVAIARRGRRPAARWRGVAAAVSVVLAVAVAVVGLGLLADVVGAARVPEATAPVRVHVGESLWQVARRAAPSADTGAVAARIVELNHLGSPSVQVGEVLLAPIG